MQGMDSGFGDDEAYNVYSKPWCEEHAAVANNIYRPSKKLDAELYSDDLDALIKNKRSASLLGLLSLPVRQTKPDRAS